MLMRGGTKRDETRPTDGEIVSRTAGMLGKPLLPWQRYVADVAGVPVLLSNQVVAVTNEHGLALVPHLYRQLLEKGHKTGNHTFNHVQGWKSHTAFLLENTAKAAELIDSKLFRPPHGHMRVAQNSALQKAGYSVVMWDVVTRDYSRYMSPQQVLENVKRYTRDGSVIVFHDSLKAEKRMKYALPRAIEWLLEEGYSFALVPG